MTAFRGHLVGDDALWRGVQWYTAFSVTNSDGTAYSLAQGGGYTASVSVLPYPTATSGNAFVITASIDAPSTAGTGLMACTASASANVAPGKYSYILSLIPATPSSTMQPILAYGDLEVRAR